MTTKYCDHGLYAAPVAAGTVPTAAEDGNGAGKTAATMATMVITFTGIPAADGAVTVAGITFTAKASGATGNQFNAVTDATTCATNLKNAINASTTNAIKPTGSIAATAPLRNIVNATSSAGVLTIYTRQCGSEWNSTTETSTLTNATISAQWSGGADGAWGYFSNPAAVAFPTSMAIATYGVFSTSMPYLGGIAAGDKVVIRSAKTITHTNSTAAITPLGSAVNGTKAAPVRFVIDDGTEWPADGSTPVFQINWTANGSKVFGPSSSRAYILEAKKYSDSLYGFKIVQDANTLLVVTSIDHRLTGCHFQSTTGWAYFTPQFGGGGQSWGSYGYTEIRDCKIASPNNSYFVVCPGSSSYQYNISFINVVFSNAGNASANTGVLYAAYAGLGVFRLDGCRFTDFVSGSLGLIALSSPVSYFFNDCDWGNIGIFNTAASHALAVIASSTQYANRDFFFITAAGFVEWTSNRAFPTLSAVLLDAATPWSIHMVPTTTAGALSMLSVLETPRIGKINSFADGVRTITVQVAVHESQTWDRADISLVVDYLGADGVINSVSSYDIGGTALTTSSVTWSSESGGQVTYVDNSLVQYHNKYSLSVTTPTSVETGTEISARVRIHTHVASTTQGVFVDPEMVVT